MRINADINLDLLTVSEQMTFAYLTIKAMGFDATVAMNSMFDELSSAEEGADVPMLMHRAAFRTKDALNRKNANDDE